MAGALFARIKIWTAEVLNFADLNAEIQNILDKLMPQWIDDYSATVAQMKLTTDPGTTGSESQATSLSGEIERLRFVVDRILGSAASNWYDVPSLDLTETNNLISAGNKIPNNRIVSGRTRSATDSFPIYLVPKGSTNEATLKGTTTPLVYRIAGTSYTISSDVDITGQSTAPSSNNTALVNDTALADQDFTRTIGEDGTELTIDTVGSEITALVGQYAAFSINDGATDEYFFAYVKNSTTLSNIRRGYFFNSADSPVKRVAFANNDTITLLRVAYIFATTTGTLASTLNLPKIQRDEPSSPVIGDYWFDVANGIWKVHNGSTFNDALATFVGYTITDSSNTIGARSEDIFAVHEDDIDMEVELEDGSVTNVRAPRNSSLVVNGTRYSYKPGEVVFSISDHLDDGDAYSGSETASTFYFLYIDDLGDLHISDQEPYDRRSDLKGYYHPYHYWRLVGSAFNDASSDFQFATEDLAGKRKVNTIYTGVGANTALATGSTEVLDYATKVAETHPGCWTTGASANFVVPRPGFYEFKASVGTVATTAGAVTDVLALTLFRAIPPAAAAQYRRMDNDVAKTTSSHTFDAQGSVLVRANRGDTFDFRAFQDMTASLTLQSSSAFAYMSISEQ